MEEAQLALYTTVGNSSYQPIVPIKTRGQGWLITGVTEASQSHFLVTLAVSSQDWELGSLPAPDWIPHFSMYKSLKWQILTSSASRKETADNLIEDGTSPKLFPWHLQSEKNGSCGNLRSEASFSAFRGKSLPRSGWGAEEVLGPGAKEAGLFSARGGCELAVKVLTYPSPFEVNRKVANEFVRSVGGDGEGGGERGTSLTSRQGPLMVKNSEFC